MRWLRRTVTLPTDTQTVEQRDYSNTEFRAGAEEAEDEPSRIRQAKKIAWVDPDSLIEKKANGGFVGAEGGNAQDGVPAAFDIEAGDGALRAELAIEFGEVGGNAILDLLLDGVAAGQPVRQGPLHRGVDREEGVGDDLEPVEGGGAMRSGGNDPGGLHLGQAGDLAEPADDKDGDIFEAGGKGRDGACGRRGEPVVEKDFVDDEGKAGVTADGGQFGGFPGLGEMAGRVVGVDEDDGAGVGRNGAAESFGIDLPAVVVDQRGGCEANVVEHGQEIEKRVAGLG